MSERSLPSDAVVGAPGVVAAPPDAGRPEALVAWQLVTQARACQVMGSPLYAYLLTCAAQDVLAGGVTAELLLDDVRPGRGDAAALRFLAAVHRLVLDRRAPELALHYPSVGGTPELATVGPALLATIGDHLETLRSQMRRPCQTNEVGRTAGLLVGLLDVAAVTGLPLALREVGAAAGLNLRLDRFRFELPGGVHVGPADAELVLRDRWRAPVPHAETTLRVVDRRGVDLAPIDPTSAEGRLRLSASVWADQTERFARLGAGLRTAAAVPATVDAGRAPSWVATHAAPRQGWTTVVFHSIVEEYLDDDERAALHETIVAHGQTATERAPLAWVRMEPSSQLRHHAVSVRVWPHAPAERHVATTGAHGDDVVPLRGQAFSSA